MIEVKNLKDILGQALTPVRFTLLFNRNEYSHYSCLYTDSTRFEEGKEYLLYDLLPLIRVLSVKAEVIDYELARDIFGEQPSDDLCYIYEWSHDSRIIFFVHFEQIEDFDEELFMHILKFENASLQKPTRKLVEKYFKDSNR